MHRREGQRSELAGPDQLLSGGSTLSAEAKIAPIDPGKSKTIVFDTPTPDGLLYPFKSSEPGDGKVSELNDGQWSVM